MADRTESVVLDFEVDMDDSIESIESLTKANKELRTERNKLNLESKEGQKRLAEINAQLDKNTDKIKDNVSAIEKQKMNIGNYRSALEGVVPGLGAVTEGLEDGAKGFRSMAKSALAFIATPIGAILAALVTVFTLLKTAISTNDAAFDKFENITNAVSTVINVLVGRVGKLGQALIALAEGNFSEALDLTSQAFGGLADEIERATTASQLYLDISRELEDSQRELRILSSQYVNEIKRLEQASKNVSLTFDEQEQLLRKALALEEELVIKRTRNAQVDLINTTKQIALSRGLMQSNEETFSQFLDRLFTGGVIAGEELDKIVEKIEAAEQARGSSLAFQAKLENDLAKIQKERAAALEKQNAALAEQAALERANRRAQTQLDAGVDDPLVNAFQTRANLITNIEDRLQDDLEQRRKEADAAERQRVKAGAEYVEQIEQSKLQIISNAVGAAASLYEQDSEGFKILASAQALINTYLAATAALASGSKINPIFGIISAAAAVASGLASVAKINGIEFAEGGVVLKGKSHAQGGIPIEAEGDEIILTKGVYRNPTLRQMASDINVAGGGRKFADGGLVANAITGPINQQMEIANIFKTLPPIEVGVKEITKVQNRVRVKESLSKR